MATASALRQINAGGAKVVGEFDNERPSSRTYATASMAALAPPPMRDENVRGRRADAGEAWCGSESPCDSVAQEPVELLIAAMSAKARLISGRLLPAAHTDPAVKELVSYT